MELEKKAMYGGITGTRKKAREGCDLADSAGETVPRGPGWEMLFHAVAMSMVRAKHAFGGKIQNSSEILVKVPNNFFFF